MTFPHNCLKSLEDTRQKPIKVCEKCGKLWENYHGVFYRYYENIHDVELWNYGTQNESSQWT